MLGRLKDLLSAASAIFITILASIVILTIRGGQAEAIVDSKVDVECESMDTIRVVSVLEVIVKEVNGDGNM